MKIWMVKKFLVVGLLIGSFFLTGCSSRRGDESSAAQAKDIPAETSLKGDRAFLDELRKNIPEERRRENDKLAEQLNRWKILKTEPETLRSRFSAELSKMRESKNRVWKKRRDDFNRMQDSKRKAFQAKQKSDRDSFYSDKKKPSEERTNFINKQGSERDLFNTDLREERDLFEDTMRTERKDFESDIQERWTEFRTEFPEYSKLYREMKEAEKKKKETEEAQGPKPYTGWPYKDASASKDGSKGKPEEPKPENKDVNKGGNGWPTTDPSEFDQMPKGN